MKMKTKPIGNSIIFWLLLAWISVISPHQGSSSAAAAAASSSASAGADRVVDDAMTFARCAHAIHSARECPEHDICMIAAVLKHYQENAQAFLRKVAIPTAQVHADDNLWSARDVFLVVMETPIGVADAMGRCKTLRRLVSIVSPVGQHVVPSLLSLEEHEATYAEFVTRIPYSLLDVSESLRMVEYAGGRAGRIVVEGIAAKFRFVKVRRPARVGLKDFACLETPTIFKNSHVTRPSTGDVRSIVIPHYDHPCSKL